jgi:cysteine desulfurase
LLECHPSSIFFTSGGTEANNWVIKDVLESSNSSVFCSAVEHKSVLAPVEYVKRKGATTGVIGVGRDGLMDMAALDVALSKKPYLVSVQYANNETGVVQNIKEIAKAVHGANAYLHVDATQAVGKIPVCPEDDMIDLMTLSAHKMHGPKGVGALYVTAGLRQQLLPMIHGGNQEDGKRSGTMPVALIVGFGVACELARVSRRPTGDIMSSYVNWLELDMKDKTDAVRNGSKTSCLPNVLNVTFPGVDARMLVSVLSERFGICVSTGAACSRGEPSYVLSAMGLSASEVNSSVRISLSRYTTESQIRYFSGCIQAAIRMAKEKQS